jgi:hypothetical protein
MIIVAICVAAIAMLRFSAASRSVGLFVGRSSSRSGTAKVISCSGELSLVEYG